jgi:hypothetical protein
MRTSKEVERPVHIKSDRKELEDISLVDEKKNTIRSVSN